jgi:hypothetical protein
MNNFINLNNKYYITDQDLSKQDPSELERLEKGSWEGTTKDGKKVYILKDRFDSLSDEIKHAFMHLKDLDLKDFQNLTLSHAERENLEKIKKAMYAETSKTHRKQGLVPSYSFV